MFDEDDMYNPFGTFGESVFTPTQDGPVIVSAYPITKPETFEQMQERIIKEQEDFEKFLEVAKKALYD